MPYHAGFLHLKYSLTWTPAYAHLIGYVNNAMLLLLKITVLTYYMLKYLLECASAGTPREYLCN